MTSEKNAKEAYERADNVRDGLAYAPSYDMVADFTQLLHSLLNGNPDTAEGVRRWLSDFGEPQS